MKRKIGHICAIAIVPIVVGALVCCYFAFPTNDATSVTECVESHVEQHVVVSQNPGAMGGIPIGNNLETVYTSVCDRSQTRTCSRWKKAQNLFGRQYLACEVYQ